MCLITRVPELDILFTSANVKIILEGVDCTCNVRTLLVDMDPTLHSLDNSIPCCHACSFRQRTGLAYLLQTLETTWSRSSFTHCCLVARHHCRLTLLNTHLHVLRADCWCSSAALTSSARCAWRSLTSCHQPSSLSLGVQILGVLQALLMIDSSSITLFLCASLGPWCSHDIIRESSVHHCLLAERCQSTHSS